MLPRLETGISVADYDLAATLSSGQAFRWICRDGAWEGVIGSHWVRLAQTADGIAAQTAEPVAGWTWLTDYLQTSVDLNAVLARFPTDEPMREAVNACRGLRLLRQDPWECLASFILSSTKQIVQIQQIVRLLCSRFGDALPSAGETAWTFPSAARLAECTEAELRACKMGFRAPNLLRTAQLVAENKIALEALAEMPVEAARAELIRLPGVGRKIADCVLLFGYGFQEAFPIDVWVMKALRQLYFRKRNVKAKRLERFSATYFGIYSGYAQQYLFHYIRTKAGRATQATQHKT